MTVFDNSPAQLAQDELVSRRDGLPLRTVEGDAADLSAFPDATFDAVVICLALEHVDDFARALTEAARVLEPGGTFLLNTPYSTAEIWDQLPRPMQLGIGSEASWALSVERTVRLN